MVRLAQTDPAFQRFIYEGIKVAPDSRVEEIQWGGVRVDGIPALDNPQMIDPAEADYLVPGGQNLVVVYDQGGLGARAYERAEQRFTPVSNGTSGVIRDESDVEWQVTEAALVSPDGTQLSCLPGHMAYWFG